MPRSAPRTKRAVAQASALIASPASTVTDALMSRMSRFSLVTAISGAAFGGLLLLVRGFRYAENFDAVLWVIGRPVWASMMWL